VNLNEAPQQILVIDQFLPMHDRSSGSHRLWEMLRALVRDGHQVTLLAVANTEAERYVPQLEALGVQVLAGDRQAFSDMFGVPVARVGLPTFDFPAFVKSNRFDLALISFYTSAAYYMPLLRKWSPDTEVVVDTVDIHWVRERRAAELNGDVDAKAQAEETYRRELATYRQADRLIAITNDERALLQGETGKSDDVIVIPNIHELQLSNVPFEERTGLVFVGNFWHPPNAEGLAWFLNEVWPLVKQEIPTITLQVVGKNAPDYLSTLVHHGIHATGWVESMVPYLANARLSIAPLLTGAGMKGKVGEAMSMGTPVVTTSIGAEGIGIDDGVHALVADSPQHFAAAITTAYSNPSLWFQLAENAAGLIADRYTPKAVTASIRKLVAPTHSAPLHFFHVVDWDNSRRLREVLADYATSFKGQQHCTLELGILDDSISVEAATECVMAALTELGEDPDSVPDMSLTPMSSDDLPHLAPDVIQLY
jgi:O-antigen biosynthesis protein